MTAQQWLAIASTINASVSARDAIAQCQRWNRVAETAIGGSNMIFHGWQIRRVDMTLSKPWYCVPDTFTSL